MVDTLGEAVGVEEGATEGLAVGSEETVEGPGVGSGVSVEEPGVGPALTSALRTPGVKLRSTLSSSVGEFHALDDRRLLPRSRDST